MIIFLEIIDVIKEIMVNNNIYEYEKFKFL